ncbi:PRC-barrel domain-containing protein [Paraburkholderia sp.]|uniref:PRC-barrel domain-containing protein n=1 Tax=Paraburkholderia sp. TaxID=1926495 RepID=UPI00239A6371|nr:PRC-barrel domain-containing protein [Paraburkholderia sp.]MDE1184546.1 PRC-barrel domain-containing protein [Paraburkholderia sp.]
MTDGFPRQAFRLPIVAVMAALILSGCSSWLRGPQQAPIVEATPTLLEVASAPVEASAPEPEPPEPEPSQPKKPKKPVVKPRHVEPPAPEPAPPPPPPPPPPLITTRTIERSEARALLDSEVQRPDGKVVGRAVDLVTDANGKPRTLVVNLQGFLGVGDRKVSFPWSLFRFTPTAKTAPVTMNPPPKMSAADRAKATAALQPTADSLPLLDADVVRSNGSKVGRIVDVLIDAAAQPQAVVVDVSGMVTTERRTIAANWSALHFATRDKTLRALLDLNDAQLNASPPYAADKPIRAVSPAAATAAGPATPAAPAAAAAAPSTAAASSAKAPR